MHSPLLDQYLVDIQKFECPLPVLDLACGSGRNGLFILEKKLPVTFADIKTEALADVKQVIKNDTVKYAPSLTSFWPVDFEEQDANPFIDHSFSAIMVFRYLHRPLIEKIKAAVVPNGFVIYETFTLSQAELGRPKNLAFLLKPRELAELFADWEILHYFEGTITSDTGNNNQAVAQIVARKPL